MKLWRLIVVFLIGISFCSLSMAVDQLKMQQSDPEASEINHWKFRSPPSVTPLLNPFKKTVKQVKAPQAVLTVGTNCTFSTISSAISSANLGDVIRVSNETFSGNAAVFNISD
ncbi:MAG: hypothetical protein ACWA5R_05755, partial [bacterium]